jgi:CBS domain-containing protein
MHVEAIVTREFLTVSSETPLKDVARVPSGNHISGVSV